MKSEHEEKISDALRREYQHGEQDAAERLALMFEHYGYERAAADIREEARKWPNGSQGWSFWLGGECPVPDGTPIEIIYRCGESVECLAGDHASNDWRIGSKDGYDSMDIIAWRILSSEVQR